MNMAVSNEGSCIQQLPFTTIWLLFVVAKRKWSYNRQNEEFIHGERHLIQVWRVQWASLSRYLT